MGSRRELNLRRPDRCSICRAELPTGTRALWDSESRTVTCEACQSLSEIASPDSIDGGLPGGSALREYDRLHQNRDARARKSLGALGGFIAAVTGDPASTRVWRQGGMGEIRTAERLEKLLGGTGVRLLHDRRVPGHGRANIDHLAVGPGGVTVIDTKTYLDKLSQQRQGGLFSERRTVLFIDGHDRTALISGVHKQIGYVRAALRESNADSGIAVVGALCFPDPSGLPWFGRIEIDSILVDGPRVVARLASRTGPLAQDSVDRLFVRLSQKFPLA